MSQETKGGSDSVPRKGDWSGFYGGSEENRQNAGELVDAMFPEGGKKTFLGEKDVAAVARLKALRSAVKNIREDISQKENLKKTSPETPDLDKTIGRLGREIRKAKRERDGIVESLRGVRESKIAELAAAEQALEELHESGDESAYRKKLRERFVLKHAVEELDDVIGERGKSEEDDRTQPTDEDDPSDALDTNERLPVAEAVLPESSVLSETKKERLERIADGFRKEIATHDAVLADLTEQKTALEGRNPEGLSEKVETLRGVLTGAKSISKGSGLLEKLTQEKFLASEEKLKDIDDWIQRIAREKTLSEERLGRVLEIIASLDSGSAETGIVESELPAEVAQEMVSVTIDQEETELENVSITATDAETSVEDGQTAASVSDSEPDGVPEEGPLSDGERAAFSEIGTEPGEETIPEAEPVVFSEPVLRDFEALGIGAEDLRSVPGFAELSDGQRLFVAESLRQVAVARMEEQARERADSGWAITKSFRLAKARKDLAGDALRGGIGTYRAELEQLTEGLKTSGLDMEEKDGAFDIRFFSALRGMGHDESAEAGREAFNDAANRLSKIPYEWSLEGASKTERASYESAREAYDTARQAVSDHIDKTAAAMREESESSEHIRKEEDALPGEPSIEDTGWSEFLSQGLIALRQADHRVDMVRQMQSHPEVDEYLGSVKNRNIFLAAFQTTLAERGGYFAAGAVGRVALAGMFGWVAAPVVAAGMGAITAKKRTKESLAGQDKRARRGDMSSVAEGTGRGFVFASIPEDPESAIHRKGLAEKLDLLSEVLGTIPDDDTEAKEDALKSLFSRISYTRKKLDAGEVNFGKGPEAIRHRMALAESLATAETALGLYGGKNEELEKRLDALLGKREKAIDSARKKHVRAEMLKGAAISGSLAFLGAAATHGISEWLHHAPAPEEAIQGGSSDSRIVAETVSDVATEKGSKAVEAAGGAYSETAGRGDGVTNLARRAFAEYAEGDPKFADLKPEQKVYIEDYLQKNVGHSGMLRPGDTVEFSQDLMDRAVGKARGLSQEQIDNLHRYSERVAEFRTGTPSVAEAVPEASIAAPSSIPAEQMAAPDIVAESLREAGAETVSGAPVYEFLPVNMEEALPWDPDVREWVPGYDEGKILYPTLDKAPESVIRSMAKDESVVAFLSEDTRRLIPFQETMSTISTDLFPSTTGGVDKRIFLEIGARPAADVFDGCFRSVADPSRAVSFGMNPEEAERLGKFLLAAHDRYGIKPKSDGSETFRAYLERVSAAMVGKLDRASALRDTGISDGRLRKFAEMVSAER